MKKPYRWWTVFGWWDERHRGVKLGPITVTFWCWDPGSPWWLFISILNRKIYESKWVV